MNRKQRRAAQKTAPPASRRMDGTAAAPEQMLGEAARLEHAGDPDGAVKLYKRLLSIQPNHAQACNNLACLMRAQGKLNDASAHFAQALMLQPRLFEQFGSVFETLVSVLPPIGPALQRAASAWPKQRPEDQLFGGGDLRDMRRSDASVHFAVGPRPRHAI